MDKAKNYTAAEIELARQVGRDLVADTPHPEVGCLGCKIGLGVLITPLWVAGMTLGSIAVPVIAILVAFGGITQAQAQEIVDELSNLTNLKQILQDLCAALGDCS